MISSYFVLSLQATSVCRPWTNSSCSRDQSKLHVRWMLRDANSHEVQLYNFLADIDRFQCFELRGSALWLARSPDSFSLSSLFNPTSSSSPTSSRLWLYGSGLSSEVPDSDHPPESSVVVYDSYDERCNGPAIVTMLVYNITLENGRYTHSKDYRPVGVGFNPTCTPQGTCRLDSAQKCLGDPGQQNCAICPLRCPYS